MKSFIVCKLSHRIPSDLEQTVVRRRLWLPIDMRLHAHVYATYTTRMDTDFQDSGLVSSLSSTVRAVARRLRVSPCYTRYAAERAMRLVKKRLTPLKIVIDTC